VTHEERSLGRAQLNAELEPFPAGRHIATNGIRLMVYEAGQGLAVVLLHGFPELAYSWRHQVPALAAAGYRVIAPDLRGYGGSDVPADPLAYSMRTLTQDVVGVLDALEIETAAMVGHDFGGMLAWHAAVYARARVAAVGSLCTPHGPRGRSDVVESYRRRRGPGHYMTAFQVPGVAEADLEADIGSTFRAILRGVGVTLDEFRRLSPDIQQVPMRVFVGDPQLMGEPLVSETELGVYVEAFRRTGFTGPLNWYRSLGRTWEEAAGTDMSIDRPALLIQAADDFFLPLDAPDNTDRLAPSLERHILENCGHWIQQERPDQITQILKAWLDKALV
jgi:soluble epoxide hydrolase / lipid-phosphate phosphatase